MSRHCPDEPADRRARNPRVAVCEECRKPIVKPVAGPRAGMWLHTDGREQCTDRYGHLWPGAFARPAREPGTPSGPVRPL